MPTEIAGRALRVLHLDDDIALSPHVARALGAAGIRASVDFVCNEEHLLAALEAGQHDLILADLAPRWLRGVDVLDLVRRKAPLLPLIVFTDVRGEEVAVDCIRRGAADFVVKSRASALQAAVRRILTAQPGLQAQALASEAAAPRWAQTTGPGLDATPEFETIRRHIARTKAALERSPNHLAALFVVDLQGFFSTRSALLPELRVEILRLLSDRIRQLLRPGDVVGRVSGTSLAVLLDDLRRHADAFRVLRKIDDIVGLPVQLGDDSVDLFAAIGVTALRPVATVPALERAHSAARSAETRLTHIAYRLSEPEDWGTAERTIILERELDEALAAGQIFCNYQPIVHAATGRPAALEALVRWKHPTLGFVSPMEFVGVAESTGQIHQLGRFVLESSLAFQGPCREQFSHIRTNVNVSPIELASPDFAEQFFAALERRACPADAIVLEITEAGLVEAVSTAGRTLEALFSGGVHIAIDDFGVGYSSLSYLRDFPVKALKIDRSFTSRLPDSERDAQIVAAVVQLAHNLGFLVTAEGVETEEQADFLRNAGCDQLQGYLFSRPSPPEEALGWLITQALRGGSSN